MPMFNKFLTELYLTFTCLLIFLFMFDYLTKSIAALQSQCIEMASKGLFTTGISVNKPSIHSAFVHVLSRAISSDYIVLLAIMFCFLDSQVIAAHLKRNIYPLVDLTSMLSDIQFASLKPFTTSRKHL